MKKPEISIITVNYNGLEDTRGMIRSLMCFITLPYEVIVVDNGSVRDEASLLREEFPEIIVLRSETNLGFAGANNLGLDLARGAFILFQNNDTYWANDSLGALLSLLENDPAAAGVSPKIIFAASGRLIQFAGYTPLSRISLRNRLIGYGEVDAGQHDGVRETPYLHGAAMLVKRSVIDEVGKMPELYFLYYEELDWSTRITRAGYRLYYSSEALVFHKESRSTGRNSALRTYYLTRNRLLYAYRNRSGFVRMLAIVYLLLIAVPKDFGRFVLKGEFKSADAILRGCRDFFQLKTKTDKE